MRKGTRYDVVGGVVRGIRKSGSFGYSVEGLERMGLEGVLVRYDYDCFDYSREELTYIWQELLEMAEENEFTEDFNEYLEEE